MKVTVPLKFSKCFKSCPAAVAETESEDPWHCQFVFVHSVGKNSVYHSVLMRYFVEFDERAKSTRLQPKSECTMCCAA